MNILKLSKIFEKFIDKHKDIEETGRGMFLNDEPERDIDIRYKGEDFVITIRKMAEWLKKNLKN